MNKETIKLLKKGWQFVKPYKKIFIFLIIIELILSGVGIIEPLIEAKVLENITKFNANNLLLFAVIILLIQIFRSAFNFTNTYLDNKMQQGVILEIRKKMCSKLLDIETKQFNKTNTGTFLERINEDPREISSVFITIESYITDILSKIGVFILVFIINKYIGLYFVATIIILYFINKNKVKIWEIDKKEVNKTREKCSGIIGELIRGVRDIKVLNLKKQIVKRTTNELYNLNTKSVKMKFRNEGYARLIFAIEDILNLGFIILCIILIRQGSLTAPQLLILYMYTYRICSFATNVNSLVQSMKDFEISATRIFNLIDGNEYPKETFGNKSIKKLKGKIEFKNVYFSYEDKKVFENLSFEIHPNETVAIVGKSGEGKTTIFNLITKLYDLNKGNIFLDDNDINSLDENTIRNNISIITQDPYIFHMTIRDNLKLVKDGLKEDEMIKKCKLARIHDYIMTLPLGYDTILGEDGVNLSGGQKQRLAIARALIKESEIILLDEATSSLDNETQREIQQAIRKLSDSYTIIIIAHRLSTIEECDRILVLHDGKIVESGNHRELMELGDKYKQLYELRA